MKSRIKQITLLDGKQLFYPSVEEYSKLWDQIETVTFEEVMTKEEYLTRYVLMDGLTITRIEPKDYYAEIEQCREVLFDAWKEKTGL